MSDQSSQIEQWNLDREGVLDATQRLVDSLDPEGHFIPQVIDDPVSELELWETVDIGGQQVELCVNNSWEPAPPVYDEPELTDEQQRLRKYSDFRGEGDDPIREHIVGLAGDYAEQGGPYTEEYPIAQLYKIVRKTHPCSLLSIYLFLSIWIHQC